MNGNPYESPRVKPKLASLPPIWYGILGVLLLGFVVLHLIEPAIAVWRWFWYAVIR